MNDTKPQAWCSYWADTHKDGICLRLRGAHEALTDLMREIREAREEIKQEGEKARLAIEELVQQNDKCRENERRLLEKIERMRAALVEAEFAQYRATFQDAKDCDYSRAIAAYGVIKETLAFCRESCPKEEER